MAKLCVTVTAPTTAELRRRRDAVRDADLVELRLDTVSDPDAAGALAGRSTPAIVTCRPKWEGGTFDGSEEERHRLLDHALIQGAEYVDVEWKAGFDDLIARQSGRVVLSTHDFVGISPELTDRALAMRATGAAVIKLAVKVNRLSDCAALVDIRSALGSDGRSVLIGMGEQGLATRVLAERFGSPWTYAGSLAEVGQVDASTLLSRYRFRAVGPATSVYGVVGSPITHSVSPAMHNAAFAATARDAVYLPLPACDADDFITFARAMKLSGASVTIPFKVPLFERVDAVDAAATRIGAINTIYAVDRRWVGTNTDATGFLRPLEDRGGVSLRGSRAAIVGAGGSARAVAVALSGAGAVVTVHARNPLQSQRLAALVSGRSGAWPVPPDSWDILVNCTPIGMLPHGDETPVPETSLTGRLVYDLVYNPPVTPLLRSAARAGCITIGGLEMLVAQAEEQFRIWTGVPPPADVMRTAALDRLAEFVPDEDHVV